MYKVVSYKCKYIIEKGVLQDGGDDDRLVLLAFFCKEECSECFGTIERGENARSSRWWCTCIIGVFL